MAEGLAQAEASPLKSDPGRSDLSSDDDDVDNFTVLCVGDKFRYTIPSFAVVHVWLRPMKLQAFSEQTGELEVYDGFIRDDPSLERSFPVGVVVAEQCIVPVSKAV